MTGLSLIQDAMQQLGGAIEAGGTPTASEQTDFLRALNSILGELQAIGLAGSTVAIAQTVSTAGVWATTTTRTPTSVALFSTVSTDNSYPTGWQAMLVLLLASRIGGSLGAADSVIARCAAAGGAARDSLMPPSAPAMVVAKDA